MMSDFVDSSAARLSEIPIIGDMTNGTRRTSSLMLINLVYLIIPNQATALAAMRSERSMRWTEFAG